MRRLLTLLALTAIPLAAAAQTHPPRNHPKDHLAFTLILSRHGIRPPLATAASLDARSSDPWPTWEVPLGHLTPHGADALAQLGLYLRSDLQQAGLIFSDKCPTPADIYLYSDIDERNVSSTRATFTAFTGPTCPALPVYTWEAPTAVSSRPEHTGVASAMERTEASAATTNAEPRMSISRDPNFLPIAGHAFAAPPTEISINTMTQALAAVYGPAVILQGGLVPNAPSPANRRSANGLLPIDELAAILSPAGSPHPASKPILQEPISTTASRSGDPLVTNHGPAPVASSLVENLLLEYTDNKPLAEVGWGRLGTTDAQAEAALQRLMPLHVAMFGYSHRTPLFARAEASNLLAHILDTLQQAAANHDLVPTPKPGNPKNSVVLSEAQSAQPKDPDTASITQTASTTQPQTPAATDPKGVPQTPPSRTPTVPVDITAGPADVKINLHPSARINGAFGPAGTKLVYLSAHDTNLAGIAALLGLHWTADSIADDTPPDSEIVFELWQKRHKTPDDWPWTIRIRYRAQTLSQLRAASALTSQTPPVELDLNPIGCKSRSGCNLADFLHAARTALDPAYTQLDIPPTQPAP